MATIIDVLTYLRPNGGYVARGEEYEGIEFIDCEPFTKNEFEAAFEEYDLWKINQNQIKENKRQAALAKLEALGLDEDDLKALGF
jgi:hypothetical protein